MVLASLKNNKNLYGGLLIFILWVSYVTMAISWIGGSMLSNQIVGYFFGDSANPILTQMVNYTITFARAIANLVAAYFLIKLGAKKAVTIALLMVCSALLAPLMPNYIGYNISRMVMGLGGSMLMVYINTIISNYISQDKKVVASALNTISYNFGAFVIALLFLFFANYFYANWQSALFIFGFFSVISLLVWVIVGENFTVNSPNIANKVTKEDTYLNIIKQKLVWSYVLTFTGFIFIFVFSITSLPVILKNSFGINSAIVVILVSSSGIIGMVTSIAVSKLYISRKLILFICGAIMIISMGAAIYLAVYKMFVLSYILIFISGLFMAIQYPLLMNIVHEIPGYSLQKISIIVGYLWGFAYGFYTILTIIWSIVAQFLGVNIALGFYVIASGLLYLFAIGLPETRTNKNSNL